jgi:hypothetical protein
MDWFHNIKRPKSSKAAAAKPTEPRRGLLDRYHQKKRAIVPKLPIAKVAAPLHVKSARPL